MSALSRERVYAWEDQAPTQAATRSLTAWPSCSRRGGLPARPTNHENARHRTGGCRAGQSHLQARPRRVPLEPFRVGPRRGAARADGHRDGLCCPFPAARGGGSVRMMSDVTIGPGYADVLATNGLLASLEELKRCTWFVDRNTRDTQNRTSPSRDASTQTEHK